MNNLNSIKTMHGIIETENIPYIVQESIAYKMKKAMLFYSIIIIFIIIIVYFAYLYNSNYKYEKTYYYGFRWCSFANRDLFFTCLLGFTWLIEG